MTPERALEIVHAINEGAYIRLDLGMTKSFRPLLAKLPLREMIIAKAVVEELNRKAALDADGSKKLSMVPDDRLVAAVYTILHYSGDAEVILTDRELNRALAVLPLHSIADTIMAGEEER